MFLRSPSPAWALDTYELEEEYISSLFCFQEVFETSRKHKQQTYAVEMLDENHLTVEDYMLETIETIRRQLQIERNYRTALLFALCIVEKLEEIVDENDGSE
mgnify:CR=1 FL=1